ncbi:3-dehydroquinate synthase [Rosettibacter firmus]|uniref:3-dehydroquinate synthase n=1 Tax=Rosettibacter firmus TaxID=3111522 RepID=UPI00336BD359
MKKIDIKIPNNFYQVYLGSNIFHKLSNLDVIKRNKNIFLVVDKNLYLNHRDKISLFYNNIGTKKFLYVFEATEKNKSFTEIKNIIAALIKNNFGRDTLLISIGGGITGDVASFAASIYSRGIKYINVPTTLLSMVDSSVGGKTGINFGNTKNIVGTFYQPDLVFIDIEFLKTLPHEEIVCGMGEILKYGLLIGDNFFEEIKNKRNKILEFNSTTIIDVIKNCIQFKSDIVRNDEKEKTGLRKVLNLGHTFAHAIEVEQKHHIKHGQAVIAGLACALHLSNKINLLNDSNLEKYLPLLISFADSIDIQKYDTKKLYEIMKRDKKNKDEKIKFVLLKKAGELFVDIETKKEDVIYALNNGLQYYKA